MEQVNPFRQSMLDVMLSSYVFFIHALALFGVVCGYFAIKEPVQLCSFAVKGFSQMWR